MQPAMISIKDDGDYDRTAPSYPPVRGGVTLSSMDAALLIDFVLRSPSREAWMVEALTNGSKPPE